MYLHIYSCWIGVCRCRLAQQFTSLWAQAIDNAKKRAVGQHVDYDTFKNMVSTAFFSGSNLKSQELSQTQLGRPSMQVSVAHLRPLQEPNRVVRGEPDMLEHAVCAGLWHHNYS